MGDTKRSADGVWALAARHSSEERKQGWRDPTEEAHEQRQVYNIDADGADDLARSALLACTKRFCETTISPREPNW